jgi:hypothetical protein
MSKTNHACKLKSLPGLIAFLLFINVATAFAQATAFTYQGRLVADGSPVSGLYDFEFKLFETDTVGTGAQQGATLQRLNVEVANGIFTVPLDFGACVSCFDGTARYLEIGVRAAGGTGFTTLAPRQAITATPYALKSLNAGTADGLSVACLSCITSSQIASLSGSKVVGPIPVGSVPSGSSHYVRNTSTQQAPADFNISGNGTAGGTLSAAVVNAATWYEIDRQRVLSVAGTNNTFVGVNAGEVNPGNAAIDNSFFGASAGRANTDGDSNSFFGARAGIANTTGTGNSFFGASAGESNTTGTGNSFFGLIAGISNKDGFGNSFFGRFAGGANTTGDSNSFFGRSTGLTNTTGSNNTLIGQDADVASNNLTFATALGAEAVVNANDTIVLGKNAGTYDGTARPADTVRVPGKILAGTNADNTSAVGVGEYYRDNAIVAWAKVSASGVTGDNEFGIAGITHTATGIYTITLTASAANNTFLIPVAIAEIDSAPTSAATLRIVSVNQSSTNSFQVFINNGTGTLVDNEFVFIATAR